MLVKIAAFTMLLLAVSLVVWLKPAQATLGNPKTLPLATTVSNQTNNRIQEQPTTELSALTEPLVEPELVTEEPFSAQFDEIATDFADRIQYPSESQPIFDASAIIKYKPNQGAAMQLEENGVRLSLQTDQLQYAKTSNINGKIEVNGLPNASVNLTVVQLGQTIATATATVISNNMTEFTLPALGQMWTEPQILLVARVTNNAQEWTVSTPINQFNAEQSTAQLAELESSFVDGAWLMIPVRLSTKRKGYYRIEANLYSQSDARPLVHLVTEQELRRGSQTMHLKAHVSALKAMGDEGDYKLADIAIEQMPTAPDFETITGISPLTSSPVGGFPFSEYDDEPYRDTEAQARLEFLQGIANDK